MSFRAYEEYIDTENRWIGSTPVHWELRRLSFCLGELQSGSREKVVEGQQATIPSLGGEHIGFDSQIKTNNMRFISREYFEQLRTGHINSGDVLLVKDGATIGKVALVREMPFPECAVNEHVFILRSNHDCTPRWLFYNLQTSGIQQGIWERVTGSAQPGLNSGFAKNLNVCVPPLPEQTAIASFLDTETSKIDGLVSEQRRLIELLKEKRQAVISHAVTKGLNPDVKMKPSGIQWLGDVPEHWEIWKFAHFAPIITCGVAATPEYVDNGVPFLSAQNIKKNKVNFDKHNYVSEETHQELSKHRQIRPGDVLMSRVGAKIGESAVLYDDIDFSIFVSLTHIRTDQKVCVSEFLVNFFEAAYFKTFANVTTAFGGGVGNLNVNDLRELRLALPAIDEQKEIVAFIEEESNRMATLLTEAERAIELLQERRTALISAAVTGKIDVRGYAQTKQEAVA